MKEMTPDESVRLYKSAHFIIVDIGRACGYLYSEIDEVVKILEDKHEDYCYECEQRNATCNAYRIAFFAMVEYRKNQKFPWYKPWMGWRLDAIQRRYTNWWDQREHGVGVATVYVPDSFSA